MTILLLSCAYFGLLATLAELWRRRSVPLPPIRQLTEFAVAMQRLTIQHVQLMRTFGEQLMPALTTATQAFDNFARTFRRSVLREQQGRTDVDG